MPSSRSPFFSLPRLTFLAGCAFAAACMPAQAAPTVAVSIAPLQLIAAAVMEGVAEPVLALSAGQDPHSIALRPSERRTLAEADLVLWIGPALELPLAGVLPSETERLLTAQNIEGLALIDAGSAPDPHLWLSLGNVEKIASALAQRLAELDPANAAQYAQNNLQFGTRLNEMRRDAQQRVIDSAAPAWAVYHHAFAYVESELNLPPALALTDGNGTMAGVRSLVALRQAINDAQLNCLVAEPGVDAAKVRNLLDMPNLQIHEVDILGSEQIVDAHGFEHLYEAVVDAVLHCSANEVGGPAHEH